MTNSELRSKNNGEIIIQARRLTKRFGPITAVNNLDIDIYRGEVFGFLGPNGAGKSTLIRMLVGLMSPSEGNAQVLGFAIPKQADKLRTKVGYMTQKFSLYEDLSVEENLEFAAEIFGIKTRRFRERIQEVLKEFNLEDHRKRRSAVLSGGWKQRLALATSMVHQPEILFLDEPTAGVDPDSRRLFWKKLFELAAKGTTILVSTHYMDEAVRCHRLCMLRDGSQSALGAPSDLTASLKGRVVEIDAIPIEKVVQIIQEHPFVLSVTQLGNQAHVLLKDSVPPNDRAVSEFEIFLQAKRFQNLRVNTAEPNLEDVFIAHISEDRWG